MAFAGRGSSLDRFQQEPARAVRVRYRDPRQRGPKVDALHAPEVECIGKAKPGRRMSSAAKCRWQPRPPSPKGGQSVLHAKALAG
jgi:IS5 family transposase